MARDLSRRTFLTSALVLGGAALVKVTGAESVLFLGRPIRPLRAAQTIEEIEVDWSAAASRDEGAIVSFFRRSDPREVLLKVPLMGRSYFRWVAAPGGEIRIPKGDRLLWTIRIAYGDGDPPPACWTHGRCLATGRGIVDQQGLVAA